MRVVMEPQTRPVLFITFAYDDPDEASVLDVSDSLAETRHHMRGRSGYVYRIERQPDGSYGNEHFMEFLS